MLKGRIGYFNPTKKFGFITPNGAKAREQDVFFLLTSVRGIGEDQLLGCPVRYEQMPSNRSPRATVVEEYPG